MIEDEEPRVTLHLIASELVLLMAESSEDVPGNRWAELHLSPTMWHAFRLSEERHLREQGLEKLIGQRSNHESLIECEGFKLRVRQTPKPHF